jgi:hypothetical protein
MTAHLEACDQDTRPAAQADLFESASFRSLKAAAASDLRMESARRPALTQTGRRGISLAFVSPAQEAAEKHRMLSEDGKELRTGPN